MCAKANLSCFLGKAEESGWLHWHPASPFLHAASLSDDWVQLISNVIFWKMFTARCYHKAVRQQTARSPSPSVCLSLFVCTCVWQCESEGVIHSHCLYWRALQNKHFCHKSKQSSTQNAQKSFHRFAKGSARCLRDGTTKSQNGSAVLVLWCSRGTWLISEAQIKAMKYVAILLSVR